MSQRDRIFFNLPKTQAIIRSSIILLLLFCIAEPSYSVGIDNLLVQENSTENTTSGSESHTISLASSHQIDNAIAHRIKQLFATNPQLGQLTVEVNAGVVTLAGEVVNKSQANQAVALAEQVDGVVSVVNNLALNNQLRVRLGFAWENVQQKFLSVISQLPLFAVAFTVVIIFWLLARLFVAQDALFKRVTHNAFIIDLIKQCARGVIIFVGFVIALEILDATALLGSLVGALGLVGLAIGFAIRDTVENYIASILLSLRQPFAPNDYVLVEGHEGRVVRLTSRATILLTLDGNHIRVPNSIVYKGVLINFTHNPERRFQFTVGVDTAVDLTAARALAVATSQATTGVLRSPKASCLIESLGDSNVVLTLFAWTDQSQYDFGKVRSAAINRVKLAFESAGFDMPEPIYRLKIDSMALANSQPNPASESGAGADGTGQSLPTAEQAMASLPDEHIHQIADVSRDRELDAKVRAELAAENDLLDSNAPKE